jgi:hypothetical protein
MQRGTHRHLGKPESLREMQTLCREVELHEKRRRAGRNDKRKKEAHNIGRKGERKRKRTNLRNELKKQIKKRIGLIN